MTLTLTARSGVQAGERWVCSSCRLQSLRQSGNSFSTAIRQSSQQLPRQITRLIYSGKGERRSNSSGAASSNLIRTREPKLPPSPARTRFAPSPTGYLHIGGLRTALFSYLLAKRTGGQFLLRIEDTDQKRLVPDAEAKLLSDLQWAGLQWDEGPGIGGPHGSYRQSERTQIYQEHAKLLLEDGSAYRCFCSPQSAGAGQVAYMTSGCYQNCADLSQDGSGQRADGGREPFTVRLRVPADAHKRVYPDLVYGKIQRLKRSPAAPQSEDGDAGIGSADTILLKSDGTPTYHFANVVDDHLMKITHVIRGVEWSASTPLHYDIYSAFNWTPPQFAHVGLLVDQNQAKLSKRNQNMALDVASMRDTHGVMPETLVNFLALLGWSNPTKNDVMDMQVLIENFDLKFTRGNAMVCMEKLWFLQRKHIAEQIATASRKHPFKPNEKVMTQIKQELHKTFPDFTLQRPESNVEDLTSDKLDIYLSAILLANSSNYENAAQWIHRNRYFFTFSPSQIPPEKAFYDKDQTIQAEDLKQYANKFVYDVEGLLVDILQPKALAPVDLPGRLAYTARLMREYREESAGWREELMKPSMTYLREKIVMGLPGPSIDTVMAILGFEECARRLELAFAGAENGGGDGVD